MVNSANPVGSLAITDLSGMFLRQQGKWPSGSAALPVDQVESSARKAFSRWPVFRVAFELPPG